MTKMDYPLFQRTHPANRMAGVRLIREQAGVLRLRARRATAARLVLKSAEPLTVVSALGAEASLRPGWDGTLGYSYYWLELSIPAAGEVVVTLATQKSPTAPQPGTAAELAAFKRDYAARPSRFPDHPPDFRRWQVKCRRKLVRLLMGGNPPRRLPLAPGVKIIMQDRLFILRRVRYRSRPGRVNELLLALPNGIAKAPLLLALHGHEAGWGQAVEAAYTDPQHPDNFCGYFARRGWAVLQPATMKHELQHPEWTLQGEWTWDAMRALDYAVGLPEIDRQHIAVCGLSTGAHLAMNLLALDRRVCAGVVGCIFSTWHHYRRFRIPPHCDCGITAQLAPRLEQCDWAALAAPKSVQFQHGRQDAAFCPGADPAKLDLNWNTGVMPAAEYDIAFSEAQRAWRLVRAPDSVATLIHDGPHSVNNAAAFAWLEKWTQQQREPRSPATPSARS